MNEQIRIISTGSSLVTWNPQNYSNEVLALLNHINRNNNLIGANGIPTEAGQQIINDTTNILELCGDPTLTSFSETGLVIGYVQSGKTLSFTTLTAMARDNNYQLVIIIAGISTLLCNQSTERLRKDLQLNEPNNRRWSLIQNPIARTNDHRNAIQTALAQWADPTYPSNRRKTMLITVMKNGGHLHNLYRVLQGLPLAGVPTLIIDDEGDQASLNTRASQAAREGREISEIEASTIYRRINEIRTLLPHCTFLQYTATPQAPLFINIMDRLSPNFIKLLTPGKTYTGGLTFFVRHPELVRLIPLGDIATDDNHLIEPPESLLQALRLFFLGVAAGLNQDQTGNRSMMIHPSRTTGQHREYWNWVNDIVHSWGRLLAESESDPDRQELLQEFRRDHEDLQFTTPDIPSFDELVSTNFLLHAIRYTRRMEVNARGGRTPEIPWQADYSFILVGGQALDRGFTIEGLTVTYMPRNLGVGNVDTIQQRARFFGYKGNYIGYCRIFLDQNTIDAYRHIVQHEEDVRQKLQDFDVNNRHLNELDRSFVLDEMLNLTRRNVLYDVVEREHFGEEWFRIRAPHDTPERINLNRENLFNFLQVRKTNFSNDSDPSIFNTEHRHLSANLLVRDCLENLLNKLKFTRESDSNSFTTLRSVLVNYIEDNPDSTCLVLIMSATDIDNLTIRNRAIKNDEIQQLFQGRSPKTGPVVYPGDFEIKDSNRLTIQIHLLNLTEEGQIVYSNVPTLAVWVPREMEANLATQPTNRV